MKAVILAAGEGNRLKPITSSRPKPMIPIAGKPLLEHTIVGLRNAGISDICLQGGKAPVGHVVSNIYDFLHCWAGPLGGHNNVTLRWNWFLKPCQFAEVFVGLSCIHTFHHKTDLPPHRPPMNAFHTLITHRDRLYCTSVL